MLNVSFGVRVRTVFFIGVVGLVGQLEGLLVAVNAAEATAPISSSVAGRTLEQTAEMALQAVDPKNTSDRVAKLRAVKSLGAFGAKASATLRQLLEDPDAAVRYTAIVTLGRLGGDELVEAKSKLESMLKNDASKGVQMACAYAISRAGNATVGLPILVERVQTDDRAVAASAAEFLGMLGAVGQPAEAVLAEVAERHRPGGKGDYHIGAAAANALREIRQASKSDSN